MTAHLQVVSADDGVLLVCAVCDGRCVVPASLTVDQALTAFAACHPAAGPHPGGCPEWPGGR